MPTLPWEEAQIMRHLLYQACLDHGCTAFSHLQQVLHISDQAHYDSVVESLLLRLNISTYVVPPGLQSRIPVEQSGQKFNWSTRSRIQLKQSTNENPAQFKGVIYQFFDGLIHSYGLAVEERCSELGNLQAAETLCSPSAILRGTEPVSGLTRFEIATLSTIFLS